ncbi:MAG: hypothetical protein KOO60_07715 [Gemmatimonadales bacterium]|nr:hypothetical protein [Gemmatimonadales bacterium]
MVLQMGATELPWLVGEVAIPAWTAVRTEYWMAEDSAPNKSKVISLLATWKPPTINAYNHFNR